MGAFDDAFVFRYDANTREGKEKINVRYVFGPKHRVLMDLNEKAKTLTLPVVAVEQVSITRDASRILNKSKFFTRPNLNDNKIGKIPTPIPINMEVNLSIIGKFKEDIDQIIQNFVVYCNPYIIVYWKTPDNFNMPFIDEIRSEIQWSGNITYDNPKDLNPQTKWRISADTSFTIKGWLFPSIDTTEAPIYTVRTEFAALNFGNRIYNSYDDYPSLSGQAIETEYVTVSAHPQFTNIFYSTSGENIRIWEPSNILSENQNTFIFYGKRFSFNNSWYLSSGDVNFAPDLQEIHTGLSPVISAYRIPNSFITTISDNIVSITIPRDYLVNGGEFTFVTANSAAWTTTGYSNVSFNAIPTITLTYLQPGGTLTYLQPGGISLYIQPL